MTTPLYPDIKVQLTGQDGNAFFIIARVRSAMRKAKIENGIIEDFAKEAMSGDYDNVLRTCMKYVEVNDYPQLHPSRSRHPRRVQR